VIVDSSAFLAVLLGEPEGDPFLTILEDNPVALSAATLAESQIVLRARRGAPVLAAFDELLRAADAVVVPVDEHQARVASDAYARFGRGSGHPARLNYGDCFSYALAISRDEPLLYKGDDFVHTDVRPMAP